MSEVTIQIPPEYVGMFQHGAMRVKANACSFVQEDLEHESDLVRSDLELLGEAEGLEDQLAGFREERLEVVAGALALEGVAREALVDLSGELHATADAADPSPDACRRIADAIDWFVAIYEQAQESELAQMAGRD